MKPYPALQDKSLDSVANVVDFIVRERKSDVTDTNNLPNIYIRGRNVSRVPASSTDVLSTDNIGDVNFTATYAYFCVDNGSGVAVWRRTGLNSW